MIDRASVVALADDIAALEDDDIGGCCLHNVLEDHNLDDGSIEWCRAYAEERGHEECADIARRLLQIPENKRHAFRGIREEKTGPRSSTWHQVDPWRGDHVTPTTTG